MDIPLDWAMPQIIGFMLVVARMSGLFLLAPVFSSRMIPVKIKVMSLFVLAACMTPIVTANTAHGAGNLPIDGFALTTMLVKETLIGFALGFAVAVVFSAVQVGASMIDTSIGFSLASIIDPLNNSQASIFGSFYTMVATLSFLSVQGHYWLLAGFVKSFDIIPVDVMPNFARMLQNSQDIFVSLFAMAFQIAAPILVTLLMTDVVLGIVSRVVPQMNVFFVGIPLKIGVGMAAVIIGMPTFVSFFEGRVSDIITGLTVLANTAPK